MAATLFADPPQASMEEARDHFMAAEELKPDGWKENRQFLAKTYIHLKDYKIALEWLDKANEIPIKNPDVSLNSQTDGPWINPSFLDTGQKSPRRCEWVIENLWGIQVNRAYIIVFSILASSYCYLWYYI